MSRRHRPSKADRKPVTRRYVARVAARLYGDLAAVIGSAMPEREQCPTCGVFEGLGHSPSCRLLRTVTTWPEQFTPVSGQPSRSDA